MTKREETDTGVSSEQDLHLSTPGQRVVTQVSRQINETKKCWSFILDSTESFIIYFFIAMVFKTVI